jgi:hypothetical protein
LPANKVAVPDVIVSTCVNGPRACVKVTSNGPEVPLGIATVSLIVKGVPDVGVTVKLK